MVSTSAWIFGLLFWYPSSLGTDLDLHLRRGSATQEVIGLTFPALSVAAGTVVNLGRR
jgi:hypothetical protein